MLNRVILILSGKEHTLKFSLFYSKGTRHKREDRYRWKDFESDQEDGGSVRDGEGKGRPNPEGRQGYQRQPG